ncbi:MAG: hypothetical protein VX726_13060 [Planctomycetota bacterium]|jgi:hypothetical protein|nr:hypothetical protein [Planctomycetota bacterium]
MRLRPPALVPLAALALVLLGGCSSRTATFPGHSDPEVWNAMVTVAENPEYDDWHVFENEVMTDRPAGRIEIYRILRRDLVRPGTNPVRQEEDWRFQVQFLHTDPPTIRFGARQAAVPAHLWRESDRFFADMRSVLEVAGVETEASTEDTTSPAESNVVEPSRQADETLSDLLDADRP